MATATFKLRNTKTDNATISVYLTINRTKRIERSTGLTINPKYWKSESKNLTGFPKKVSEVKIKNLRTDLKRLESHLLDNVNIAATNGTIINSVWVKEQINSCFNRVTKEDEQKEIEQKELNKLTYQTQLFIDNAKTYVHSGNKVGLSKSRVKSIKTFKRVITEFEKYTKKTIYLKNINYTLEESLNSWLNNVKDYSINTSGTVIKDLKTICRYAKKKELEVNPHYEFIKSYKQQKKNKIIQTLSFEELETIENWKTNNERLDNVRKWIIIGCNMGQRVEDLLNITLKNFVTINGKKYIELTQEKTGKEVLIPITKQCERVLSTGLPYAISQQKLNEYIKEVCKENNITEIVEGYLMDKETNRKIRGKYPKYKLIASHTFRRSYATNNYIDIPTPVIMEITGHSKESTFLEYVNKPVDKTRNANLMLELMELAESKRLAKKETPIKLLKTLNK